jgi:serralysin
LGLDGGSGRDTLEGSYGDDVIDGGAGRDQLDGGSGADRFAFDEGDSGVGSDVRDVIYRVDANASDRIVSGGARPFFLMRTRSDSMPGSG